MPKYLVLPKIGMNMEEGVIDEWLIKPGDKVEKEQIVLRAETDKAVQDIFATDAGIVYKLLAQPGDTVPCQEKIAILLEEGGEYTQERADQNKASADPKPEPDTADVPERKPGGKAAGQERKRGKVRISPLAKKMAEDLGIPIEELSPKEEGKRIVKADVLRYEAPVSRDASVFVPFTPRRKAIARHMLESANHKPRVTLVTTVDCENLIAFREKLKKQTRVSYNEIIVKACAAALRAYPHMNCITQEGGFCIKKDINIGVAVDTPDGLLVPVLKNADKKGIFELAGEFGTLTEKARNGRLSGEDMSGGTFSVSNVGMFGIESFDPIINSPECLILGVGCMKETAAVVEHEICVRTCMQISLSFDHTVFDGAAAAKLLKAIKDLLDDPVMMLA